MAPNPVAENVLGTMGTICWAGQLIPQVWKNYKDKKTTGLSPWLMLIWGISSAFLGVYAILQNFNIPLKVQPQLFGFLALVSWGQCLYYDPSRQNKKGLSFGIVVGTMIIVGALEVMLVFVTRPAYERGISAPVQLYGVLSVVLIASGLLPQYWEIYLLREVKGISYTFICIDMLGGVLNTLSLAFASEFNGLAAASYTAVTIMDSVIIIAALILNPRARKRRRLAGTADGADIESAGERVETETSTTPSPETREVAAGDRVFECTRSRTLDISDLGDKDVDTERAGVEEKETTESRVHDEQEMDQSVDDSPAGPASGTTTVVGDSGSLNTEASTAEAVPRSPGVS
ncbi:hypothetical protein D9756_002428 [Leucocoprinus leucothites]|uniref:PQ-loop-domain-containing protein n=1 Tax=Leucocoprinus leucothites TaxID=201217 RepID=A0A8H5GBP6_9AGAR|nr:hypothetical protein D9756_002428 [Leucoagaricus leucothites]